jgi:hypothetical protein
MFGRQESTRTDFKLDLALNSMAQKRRWSFTLDVMDYEGAAKLLKDLVMAPLESMCSHRHLAAMIARPMLVNTVGMEHQCRNQMQRIQPTWKSRYVVSVRDAVESFSFDELVLAVTYARSLPVGEVAEIAHTGLPAGELFPYIVTSGTNVVGFNHSHTKATPPVEEST